MLVESVSDSPVDVVVDPGRTSLGAQVCFLGCSDHSVALIHVDPAHVVDGCSDHVHDSYLTSGVCISAIYSRCGVCF